MKTRTSLLLAVLSTALVPALHAQQSRPPAPAVLPPLEKGVKQAAKPSASAEIEIKRPEGFDDQEWRILHSMETLSTDRLSQMLLVYERLDNPAMVDVLVRTILKRDPKNKEALRVRDGGQSEETIRPAGYLDDLSRKVLSGQRVEDADSVPVQAVALILEGRAPEAVKLLEALRSNQFKDSTFIYQDDLAYALGEAGRFDEAEAAYRAVIADSKMPDEAQAEARAALPHIEIKKRIEHIRTDAGYDMQKLLAGSAALHADHPQDEDVQAFRIDSLQAAHHFGEAVDMLMTMRKSFKGDGVWPWLPELGFCYFGSRQYDKAIAIFREIQTSDGFDEPSRREAETMILEIKVAGIIESGNYAMQHGDFDKAKDVLDELESDFRSHRDVLGYRATYLAKTGRSDQALKELRAAKVADARQNLAFSQQDALVDVYMERKEFGNAREAALVMLNDPRYDPEMRADAFKTLDDINVAETQQQVYDALQNGHRAKARALTADLRRRMPARIEVRMMEAEVALAYFDYKDARRELEDIKSKPYPQGFYDMPFDAQNSLATAYAMAGDWKKAYDAFGEVLFAPPFNYEDEDIWEARWERRELLTWFRPTLKIGSTYTGEDEGTLYTSTLEYQTAWHNDWRFGAFARNITTNLNKTSLFHSRGRDTQFEGGVTAMRRFGDNYFVEGMVGASENDAIYGLRVGKLAYRSIGWSLGFLGNALSTDSVNLQSLNGRENRVEFKLDGPITDRINVDFMAWYQWNRVGGSRLGSGYGASGELEYVLQTETRKRPEISIAYAFDYSHFDAAATLPPRITNELRRAEPVVTEVRRALGAGDEVRRALSGNFGNEVFDSLIDPYTNRHGLILKARKHFENHLAISASIGAYYAFDESAIGYTASAAAEYWISETAMIYAEIRYDTSGKGASSNGGVWEANIGGQMSF